MDIIDIISVFYLLPAVLLALYTTLRQVKAEHIGQPRPRISPVFFVPVLNMALLVVLAMDRTLQLTEELLDDWKRNRKE